MLSQSTQARSEDGHCLLKAAPKTHSSNNQNNLAVLMLTGQYLLLHAPLVEKPPPIKDTFSCP